MKKWIWLAVVIFMVVIGLAVKLYVNAMEPLKQAEETAVNIAKKEAPIEAIEDFSIYHGTETYYIVRGINSKGNNLIVWIPEEEEDRKIIVRAESAGISKEEAIQKVYEEKNPQKIMSVKLGMEKNIPLWEIYYRSNDNLINYYYVDFASGKMLKDIQNL